MEDKQPILTQRQIRTTMVKQKIVKTAIDLISVHGIGSVTVANICKAAGVSVGSFYHHFENKDQVLAYYIVHAFEQNREAFEQIKSDNVVQNILDCYTLYNRILSEQGLDFVSNFYTPQNKQLYSKTNTASNTSAAPIMAKIREICQKALHDGFMKESCDLEVFLYDLTVVEKGIIFDWCLSGGSFDLTSEANRLMKNYMLNTVVTEKYISTYPDGISAG